METENNLYVLVDKNKNVLEKNFALDLVQDIFFDKIFYSGNKIFLAEEKFCQGNYKIEFKDITALKDLISAAEKDKLTGFYSKNFMMAKLNKLIKNKENFAIIFADIDNFKQLNIDRGRFNADKILTKIGEIFLDEFKFPEHVFRFGGDEILIITHQQDLKELKTRCEKVGKKFFNDCQVTCSFGIANYDYSVSIDKNLNDLDNLLNKSKLNGKNLITVKGK